LKLSTLKNCPECSDKYTEYRQDPVNRRSIHEIIGRIHPCDGRRVKINEVDDDPRKDMLVDAKCALSAKHTASRKAGFACAERG
jgi:hypothetical protein